MSWEVGRGGLAEGGGLVEEDSEDGETARATAATLWKYIT